MVDASPDLVFSIAQEDVRISVTHPSKYAPHAAARNYMLDRYLKDEHTHVLWIDSDLIDYPADLVTQLLASGAEIAAPLPLLDPSPARLAMFANPLWFYDIGGFIEQGRRANLGPPFFAQDGPIIDLESVGCCYIATAALYRAGARYHPPVTDYYVEHWSVMQQARKRGMRIVALRDVHAIHAWLPDYGLEAN
jgi:hypothetical protein